MKSKVCVLILVLSLATACTPAAWQQYPETPMETTTQPEVALTSTATHAAGLIPGPELGYDCSKVERLLPDSSEAQRIVQEFVDNFKAQWPTEYMAMETLWSVDRQGEYAVILGGVTSDERDAIVVQQTPQGYRMVSRFIVTWDVSSRYTIAEYFAEQLPQAPAELFYCMDVSRLVENAPAKELDLNRAYDCADLENIPLDSTDGQAIEQVLLDFQNSGRAEMQVELDEIRSIVRLEPYLAAQARFRREGRLEPPVLFILDASNGGYKVMGSFMGPTLTRKGFLREVYAEVPDVPPELLACLELDWFFTRPSPTPTAAANVALGRLAVAQDGDVLLKGLPEGETVSLSRLLGIDNVTVASRPRLSPSGAWLAFLLKEPDGWVFVHQVGGSGSYDLEESGTQRLFAWSPVEDRLAYVAGEGELKLTGEYGSEPRSLVPQPGKRQITGLAWSPDGRWIAYSVGEPEGPEGAYTGIWKVPVEGGEPVELFANTGSDMGSGVYRLLGWTPGGESLIFWGGNPYFSASLGADGLPLARISAEGGEPARLADSVLLYDDFVQPDPSGSGRIAVVAGGSREATDNKGLYVIGDGESTLVSPAGYAVTSPAWSPDGRYLAYAAMPEAGDKAGEELSKQALMGRKLWLYDSQTGESRQLTQDPAFRDEYPLWSADGATLLFTRMDEKEQVSLWSLPVPDGELRPVMEDLSTGYQGWSGYYGHIPWYEMIDWRRGK